MEKEIDNLLALGKNEEARLMMHQWAIQKIKEDEEKAEVAT